MMKEMVEVSLLMLMEISTQVNGRIIGDMAKVFSQELIKRNMMVNGLKIRSMVMVE